MSDRNFIGMLRAQLEQGKHLCVGLDSDYSKVPQSIRTKHSDNYLKAMLAFNSSIIDETKKIACAYKINTAFYEDHGEDGWQALQSTIVQICRIISEKVPVILDAKRADIGNTNEGYVRMAFEYLGADAITVNPYFGEEALLPFLKRADKGIIVLCKTSNPGSGEFQDLIVENPEFPHWGPQRLPLYWYVARRVSTHWNKNGNCLLVVGATYPDDLKAVRLIAPELPILSPGVGTQGGDLEATIVAAGYKNFIINSSSGIIFAENPGAKARDLHDQITVCIQKGGVL